MQTLILLSNGVLEGVRKCGCRSQPNGGAGFTRRYVDFNCGLHLFLATHLSRCKPDVICCSLV
jgi:hypothetical protein